MRRSRRARGLATVAAFGGLFALFACVAEEAVAPRPILPGEPTVRVLLVEGGKTTTLGVDGPCQVVPSPGEALLLEKLPSQPIVPAEGGGIRLGERVLAGAVECRFSPMGGAPIKVDDKLFEGELVVRAEKGTIRAINHVPLEAYTAGVLGSEMPLNWPDAALKAQSVAVRSYAVWQVLHHQADDHDVVRDTRSQVYGGAPSERARQLVRATEGRVLTYQSKVFEAFFSSTCSGHTANAAWVFGVSIPPLAGNACGKCYQSKRAHWTKEIGAAEIAKALAPFGVKAPVARIEAIQWPEGGYVREVHVIHAGGETTIEGTKVRTALHLDSTAFEVATGAQGITVVFDGHGWGHGVGLCQWGAKGCAEDGMSEDEILEKYYPSSQVVRLY
jgi:stage II sporulation protein D